jgi:sigma-B regulation protein RsbU (phosphoserine phosphatase)
MVVVDVPVDTTLIASLERETGARIEAVAGPKPEENGAPVPESPARPALSGMFQQTVAFMDGRRDWADDQAVRISVSLAAPIGGLYKRLTAAGSSLEPVHQRFRIVLVVIGVFLLVVQIAVLIIGAVVGRSITSAVHELFVGTQRIQQGDFGHRIRITSRDQLGELAESFNRMSAGMSHLLHVQRDKQRLDDELRIARDIQQSLLPSSPPRIAGLSMADLCEPAREVGGDYYDFFPLGPRQLGVVVADVSGKGTSAALYMAELKGLMLALSYAERSPRKLLIDVNRRLADQLDNRSFITMAYAVIDLDAMTLTFARAGHTPLILVSGDRADVLTPEGMVLGLRLPGALERFEQLLVEETRPLRTGDLVVLYTDGLTEAMDGSGELFGDAALAGLLAKHRRLQPAGVRERVLREVKAFVGDAEPHDDMTMVVLKLSDGSQP